MDTNDNHRIDKPLTKSTLQFPVVGIGASAGGLEAFQKFIGSIPEASGMAYIFVQHLAPSHTSVLPELLQRVTSIPVHEITDNIHIKPDNIYIIPASNLLIANDGVLELSPRPPKEQRSRPIDIFFSSLAEVHGAYAVGVVLSGTGTDGTVGLKAIKDYGGLTFAEDEASAAFEGMPNSAVQAGVVDFILPPEGIYKKIRDLKQQVIRTDDELQKLPVSEDDLYKQMLTLLRIRKGTDFTYYKQTTIRRRILRRMALNRIETPAAYLNHLRETKGEQDVLYQDLLIPVTSFFRDHKVFDTLCESVFPAIAKSKAAKEPIRIWIAGCSTGQEAYSIAICLKEFLGDRASLSLGEGRGEVMPKVQIFATDISEPAIAKARTGVYTKAEVEGLSAERLQEFFTKIDGSYQLTKAIRDLCVFAVHNFLKDPPFAKVDLVSCRNVLIYMEPYLQKKALTAFHYALVPKGYLLLGKAETTTVVSDLFAPVGKSDKLFTRKDVPGRFMHTATQRTEQNLKDDNAIKKHETMRNDFQKTAEDILLNNYTPAGVIVNEAMDIVHFRGNTGMYLEPSPGKASLNLLKMAKNGLAFELRSILHKAKTEGATAVKEAIPVLINDVRRYVSIEAIPLPNAVEPHYLILFHETSVDSGQLAPQSGGSGKKTTSSKIKKDEKDLRIQQLEGELLQLREDMRTITEDQEATNEEMQSANEELLSGSEELQSLNEELETSKEELQSTNEELTVVNQEMSGLNEQIREAKTYAESIVTTIREPLMVLDKNLRIRSANQAFYKTFQVAEHETEGVYIYDLGNRQWNIPELRTLLEQILPEKTTFAEVEVTHNFPHIGKRTMLLNASEMVKENGAEKLILLAIEDVTEQTNARKKIEESEKDLQDIFYQAPAAIAVLQGENHKYVLANALYQKMISRTEEQLFGKTVREVFPESGASGAFEIFDAVFKTGETFVAPEFEAMIDRFNEGTPHTTYYHFTLKPLKTGGKVTSLMVVAYDITEQILARKKIEASEKRYDMMVMQSPFAFAVLKGKDMIISLANDSIKEMWGKGAEIEGKPLLDVLPEIKDQGFPELLTEVYATGIPYTAYEILVRLRRKRKMEDVYFNFVYQPYREADETISGVAIIANEVTPRALVNKKIKESEEHFRMLADLMPAKISNANPAGDITYFNKQWLDFSDYGFEELRDFGYHKIVHPEELEEFQSRLQKAAATGTFLEMEMRFLNKESDYIWHLNLAAPVKDEAGNIKMWIGVTTEIQQQKEQRDELEKTVSERTVELKETAKTLFQKNEDLKKMNEELESFTYISSHDLQEPLRKIQTFTGRILEKEYDQLSETGKDYLRRTNGAASRMQALLEDLLDYSHAHIADRKAEKTDLDKIVDEVKTDFSHALLEKSATLEAGPLGEADISSFQFRQIINNLLTNSLKFAKAGVPPRMSIKSGLIDNRALQAENPALPAGTMLPEK